MRRLHSGQIKTEHAPCTISAIAHHHLKEVYSRVQAAWIPYSVCQSLRLYPRFKGILQFLLFIHCFVVHSFTQYLINAKHMPRPLPKVKMFAFEKLTVKLERWICR